MSLIDDKGSEMNSQLYATAEPDASIARKAQQLAAYIKDIDLKPQPLPEEFFYASLPLCVIDAVFSIGVTYTSTANTVDRFCERQGWVKSLTSNSARQTGKHKIGAFLNLFEGLSPEQMATDLFGNRQRTSSRSGILKAEAVKRFAEVLQDSGIDDFGDMTETNLKSAEKQVLEIPGQGSGISFDYFRMLAGNENLIKPDRMVQRFIAKAIKSKTDKVTPDLAREILKMAIPYLAEQGIVWSARQLDYAIWKRERGGP